MGWLLPVLAVVAIAAIVATTPAGRRFRARLGASGSERAPREDHEFLLAGDVFSRDLIEHWMETKVEREYNAVRNRPHPYEISLYFDV